MNAGGIISKIRRSAALALAPDYAVQSISTRRGECDRCGLCCKIGIRCPAFREDSGCAVYDLRPPACRAFPISPADLRDVERCSYTFETAA